MGGFRKLQPGNTHFGESKNRREEEAPEPTQPFKAALTHPFSISTGLPEIPYCRMQKSKNTGWFLGLWWYPHWKLKFWTTKTYHLWEVLWTKFDELFSSCSRTQKSQSRYIWKCSPARTSIAWHSWAVFISVSLVSSSQMSFKVQSFVLSGRKKPNFQMDIFLVSIAKN